MVHFYLRFVAFVVGVLIGVSLAVYYKSYVNINVKVPEKKTIPSYNIWFEKQKLTRKFIPWDKLRYQKHDYLTESQYLSNKIKVLCIILVRNSKNVDAVKNTWSRGCTGIKFIEIFGKNGKVPMKRTKENSSWVLLCSSLKDTSDKYHWIVVANDNTFIIMENLRYYVVNLNPSDKYYLGHAVTFWNTIYNSGDAGYLLSTGSLQAFKNKFQDSDCSTNTYWNREDFYLGKHLSSLNITPTDTRDAHGLSTFHPYNWYHVFFPGENYYKTSIFPVKCCSNNSIAFQAIEGDKMYTYYYLLYTLQIFLDGKVGNQPPIDAIPEEQVWKQFLKERNIPSENISSAQYYKLWEDLVDDPNSFAFNMKKEMEFDYN
ncbi:glycoprotein-N-acetylgalactosamine 3-beta-galactosyltransferase 1-like [Anoplophora glabripennis]|uniref:glycoprotein-N-acetylgalactosamine 3-beta-galactosyltransferase 1-like n=1 Tax=Anoplophora glabripennis TaxID=217634 RepID=UPI000874DB65|nr:glycoprotein-N-acetylgalactosamine 3-beta-galactosyltransferase 1-like [Anoplophora glabripennis]